MPKERLERYSTGTDGLDAILQGGFVRGSAYIVQGPPGAGKTILANQFCFGHARTGGRALYISLLAESHHRMLDYMRELAFFDESVIPDRLSYVSAFNMLHQDGLSGLMKLVYDEIRRQSATAVVLDGFFAARASTDTDHDYRRFIHELRGIANAADCTLLLLTHQNHDPASPEHTMVDGWISLQDEMRGFMAYRTLQVYKQRGGSMLRGKHSFRISDAGLQVFPRLETTLSRTPRADLATSRINSGIPGLDLMLNGGVPVNSATLVMGPTGSGKTTLGLHFLAGATPAEPALMLSFYETPMRICVKAKEIGIDCDRLIGTGALEILWYPPTENIVDEIGHVLLEQVRSRRVKRLFVDGVVALRDSLVPSERLPGFLNALNNHLRDLGVTSIYTSELRQVFLPDKLPSDEISAMIDNLLVLNYTLQDDLLRRRLSVLKLRDSSFDARSREIYIGETGLNFGANPKLSAGTGASA